MNLGYRHGTAEQYGRGCRCSECKTAHAADTRRRNAERVSRTPDFLLPAHGSNARYNSYGCRCDVCRDGIAARRAELRRK